jgi:5'-nucleotidase
MHGDFFAEQEEGGQDLVGGLSLLSGYINQVRQEEENVFYAISGDMLQGNIIDSEFQGISTIEIMNYLAPDVVALGNHELDYGLPHLLFLEKVATFPIVNANIYIKDYFKRLMAPFLILKKAGFDVLFTGIVTEKIMDAFAPDSLIGSFVNLEEASKAVGKITNAYKNADIDLTVILTHIGFESDVELARMMDPAWGVDLIIGGHSHTVLEAPAEENGVLIMQAGVGTDQVGRLDIVVDDDTNSIVEWEWKLVQIEPGVAEPDHELEQYIGSFKAVVDRKYSVLVGKLARTLTHPQREVETELGNLMADCFADAAECDVVLLGSGSVRVEELGPRVTLGDMTSCFPYDDTLTNYTLSGEALKVVFAHIMRNANRDGEGECYQVNAAVRAVHDDANDTLASLEIDGEPVDNKATYTVCLQGYHAANAEANLGVALLETEEDGVTRVVATSAQDVFEEFLRAHQNADAKVEGRLVYE